MRATGAVARATGGYRSAPSRSMVDVFLRPAPARSLLRDFQSRGWGLDHRFSTLPAGDRSARSSREGCASAIHGPPSRRGMRFATYSGSSTPLNEPSGDSRGFWGRFLMLGARVLVSQCFVPAVPTIAIRDLGSPRIACPVEVLSRIICIQKQFISPRASPTCLWGGHDCVLFDIGSCQGDIP